MAIFATQGMDAFASPGQTVLFAASCVVILFFSVFVHEGAHALVARALKSRVLNITLTFWGGVTRSVTYRPRPLASALVAVAGPLANLALAGLAFVPTTLTDLRPGLALVLDIVLWINLTLGIYNLLPGLPLDGGQVTASIAWGLSRNHTTGLLAGAVAGRVIVVLLGAFFVFTGMRGGGGTLNLVWTMFIVLMLWQMTSTTFRIVEQRRALDALTLGSVSRPAVLLPDSMPQQLSFAYAEPGRAFILHDDRRLTGVIAHPGQHCSSALEPVRFLALPVPAEPFDVDPLQPVTDFAIAMQAESRPAVALRFPSGEPRVLALDDVLQCAARDRVAR